MTDKILDYVSWNGHKYVKGPVRGIVLKLNGLGHMDMKSAADWMDLEWASHGALMVEVFHNPWAWMNDATRDLADAVIDGIRRRYKLGPEIPLIVIGGSMGGHAALAYCFKSRHAAVACLALFPVCDLVFHFDERNDLPRTYYSAYGLEDGILERLEASSPLHQIDRMPDIPYMIVHGDADTRVIKEFHSDKMVAAMRARNLNVDYIEIPGLAHSLSFPDFAICRRYLDFVINNLRNT